MKREIADKFKETAAAVLPVAGVILLLHFTVAPMPSGILALFLSSTVFLIIGMAVFTLGADIGMTPMGNQIGNKLVEKKSLALFILTSLILGILITIAEPDLQVLAKQVPAVPDMVIILTVAVGVGIFLMISMVREYFNIPIRYSNNYVIMLYKRVKPL